MPEKKPLIQVLDRALDLMEMLARAKKPLRATDIAREMGLSLQSANNLLRALYLRGYLSQDGSRSYRLGPQCLYLGSFADRWSELRAKLAPPLTELTRKTGLSGFAGIIENDRLLCVALVPAEQPELPILLLSRCSRPEPGRRDVVRRTFEQAVAAGDRQVRFIDGSELFQPAGEAYCTVDGCHPNDLGFYLMFRRTLPVLREMLGLS